MASRSVNIPQAYHTSCKILLVVFTWYACKGSNICRMIKYVFGTLQMVLISWSQNSDAWYQPSSLILSISRITSHGEIEVTWPSVIDETPNKDLEKEIPGKISTGSSSHMKNADSKSGVSLDNKSTSHFLLILNPLWNWTKIRLKVWPPLWEWLCNNRIGFEGLF
jgi:hypothetical protein